MTDSKNVILVEGMAWLGSQDLQITTGFRLLSDQPADRISEQTGDQNGFLT